MSEWKEYKLGDIAEVKGGKRLPKGDLLVDYETPHPYIRVTNLGKKWVRKTGLQFVTPEIQKSISRYTVNSGNIILSIVGSIGFVGRISDELDGANLTENCVKFLTNKKVIDDDFLFYYLISNIGQEEIEKRNVGSTQPKLPIYNIKDIDILLPPLPEQTAIASVLSSLDDKIDLLHRQNATLEKMAETLFRQWFVEEVKEEWEEIRLGSIVEVINGVSYKSDDLNPSTTAMVTLKSFDRNGGFRMDGFKEYTGKYKEQHILKEGDLVVAHTDITQEADVIGNPVMVIGNPKYETLLFSMDLVKVISKSKNYTNEFLYLLMKSREFKEHCLGYSNGSTVLHLSKKAIPEYEMKLPPDSLIIKFSKKVKPLVQKQFRNQTQIRTLTALRDTLLPKLMSGEVRVEMN